MKNRTTDPFPFLNQGILRHRILWVIRIRWIAVIATLIALLLAKNLLYLKLPYQKIWIIWVILIVINLVHTVIWKLFPNLTLRRELYILEFHILADLFLLTLMIHYSGGIENPVYFFYVFHVILSSVVLPVQIMFINTSLIILLFFTTIILEYLNVIPHYSIFSINIYSDPTALIIVFSIFLITVCLSAYIGFTIVRIYRDIKREIDEKARQLVILDKEKERFFRFASHELKSPVIAIKTNLDVLIEQLSPIADEKSLHLLVRASSRAEQLLKIIMELLDLSNSRTRLEHKSPVKVDFNDIIKKILEEEKDNIVNTDIKLTVTLQEKCQPLSGNPEDFYKLAGNLIRNAIRYTPPGGNVSVGTDCSDEGFTFFVKDDGIGIPEEDLPHIFEEFYRAGNARSMESFGTGLGLSLVNQIINNYHGSIQVDSAPGKGTMFRVRLPL